MAIFRYDWRARFSNEAMNALHAEAFGHEVDDHDWVGQFEQHSLGWVAASDEDGDLVGMVNVPWDGGLHAFVMDTAVAKRVRGLGVGTRLVGIAADHARDAGCGWLHVDFDDGGLDHFYINACGFTPTPAGLIQLVS